MYMLLVARGSCLAMSAQMSWDETDQEIIPKFVVSRCVFANFAWVFLFRQSFEWGWSQCKSQCNALAQLGPQIQNWEWPLKCSRKAKKSQWCVEFLLRAGGRHCFILARDKNKKDHKKLRRKLVVIARNIANRGSDPFNQNFRKFRSKTQ